MLTWLKRLVTGKTVGNRFEAHFNGAQGSFLQRSCIASAMLAIENDQVQKQRANLTPDEQVVFMMTYECLVMWALKQGLNTLLKREEVDSTIIAIRDHFATHAWYRPKVFEKIWDRMQREMPSAMTPVEGLMTLPGVGLMMAAADCDYPATKIMDARFEIHLAWEVRHLADMAQLAVKEHLAIHKT
jgi:hypothetical protein